MGRSSSLSSDNRSRGTHNSQSLSSDYDSRYSRTHSLSPRNVIDTSDDEEDDDDEDDDITEHQHILAPHSAERYYNGPKDTRLKHLPDKEYRVRRRREKKVLTQPLGFWNYTKQPETHNAKFPGVPGPYDKRDMDSTFYCHYQVVPKIKRKPIDVKGTLIHVPDPPAIFPTNPEKSGEKDRAVQEYLLVLEAEIDTALAEEVTKEEVEFLIILDKSPSMGGRPWQQVQAAVEKITKAISQDRRIIPTFMVYSGSAKVVTAQEVRRMEPDGHGGTNFVEAFNEVSRMLKNRSTTHQDPLLKHNSFTPCKLFIFFLTDGVDNNAGGSSAIDSAMGRLQESMANYGPTVIVHALGFEGSENLNTAFLQRLTRMGTEATHGTYSYIDPQESEAALEKRLTRLVKAAIGLVGQSVYLNLKVERKDVHFLGQFFGQARQDITVQALEMKKGSNKDTCVFTTAKFVRLTHAAKRLEGSDLSISLTRDLRAKTKKIPCVVSGDISLFEVKSAGEKLHYTMRKLRSVLNIIAAGISNSASEGKVGRGKDWQLMQEWIKVVKNANGRAKKQVPDNPNPELEGILESVKDGLVICGEALESDDLELARGTAATYFLKTSQLYNAIHHKKVSLDKDEGVSSKQAKQVFID